MRWADLDLLGHVNNVTYVDYLQEARVDMMRIHAPDRRAEELAEGVVVVRHEVSYQSPLDFRFRPVRIESWVTEIRAASFTLAYEVVDDTESGRVVYLAARSVLTPYVFRDRRPRRLTPAEQEALGAFLEPAAATRRASRSMPVRQGQGHYPVQVRFSDVDVYGHVNNVKYFEYFQEGRIALIARLTGDETGPGAQERLAAHAQPGRRPGMVVAQIAVDYRRPILFRPQPYDLWTHVSEVGRTSLVVEADICDGEAVLSHARAVLVVYDPLTRRPTPPSDAFRTQLEAALASPPPSAS
ncbi:MAG: thioesterase family protein [Nocardioides sp.]